MQTAGLQNFRIVRSNGRTGYHYFRTCDVLGFMPLNDNRPEADQPLRYRRSFQLRTRYLVAQVEQHLGDATHADAADAHKVDALNLCKH